MFSIGFISYTISVVKAALEANPELEAASNDAINTVANSGGEIANPVANLQESQFAEIVNQTTNKVVEQLLEKESQAVKEVISDQISAMIIEEKVIAELQNAGLSSSESIAVTQNIPVLNDAKIVEPKMIKKEPVVEYEDVVITDYYLRYYFGGDDYRNLNQKLNWVDSDLKSEKDFNVKQKYQENLLRDKQDALKWDEIRADMLKKAKNYRA